MAHVDYYVKIEGVDGESKSKGREKWIHIDSFSWGETNTGTYAKGTGGGGAGKVSMQDLHFTSSINSASPKLALKCATGEHIGKVTLVAQKAGGEQKEFLKFTLSDVLVSSYHSGGTSGGLEPTDQVSLNFAKIEWEYKPQDQKGSMGASVTGGFDLKTNVKL